MARCADGVRNGNAMVREKDHRSPAAHHARAPRTVWAGLPAPGSVGSRLPAFDVASFAVASFETRAPVTAARPRWHFTTLPFSPTATGC